MMATAYYLVFPIVYLNTASIVTKLVLIEPHSIITPKVEVPLRPTLGP